MGSQWTGDRSVSIRPASLPTTDPEGTEVALLEAGAFSEGAEAGAVGSPEGEGTEAMVVAALSPAAGAMAAPETTTAAGVRVAATVTGAQGGPTETATTAMPMKPQPRRTDVLCAQQKPLRCTLLPWLVPLCRWPCNSRVMETRARCGEGRPQGDDHRRSDIPRGLRREGARDGGPQVPWPASMARSLRSRRGMGSLDSQRGDRGEAPARAGTVGSE
ncbi:cold-inducible RNA-binding protein isoform 1-T1 [Erethizon dorsatum]